MLFLIRVGTTIPQDGPIPGLPRTVIGVVEAKSKDEAAKQLGIIQWDGWKKIPEVNKDAWEKWGGGYFYTPFDTKVIDRSPEKYATVNRRMRIITLEAIDKFEGRIPKEIWCQF